MRIIEFTDSVIFGAHNKERSIGDFFVGEIDDIRIYNRKIPSSEINDLYTIEKDGELNGTLTYSETHKMGSTATVTAVPDTRIYIFVQWTGANSGTDNPVTFDYG